MSLDTDTSEIERPATASKSTPLRAVIMRLHFFAGLLIAPFILVAAVTGLLYTATPQVEQLVYRNQLKVEPATTSVSLSDQVQAARSAHPDGDILEIDPPEGHDRSTRVVFSDSSVPDDYAMSVFVNPHNGEVLGQVKSFGQWLGVRAWIDELHRNLHLGSVGRHYSEMAASWLWVILLSGAVLWVNKRRRQKMSTLLMADKTKSGRPAALSWHGATGLWLVLGLIVLSVSGLTWSRYTGANISEVRSALSWTTPSLDTDLMGGNAEGAGHDHNAMMAAFEAPQDVNAGVGVNGTYDVARQEGLDSPLVMIPPANVMETWTVSENKRSWPTQYDTIAVDGQTGTVVDRVDFDQWPFMAKLTDWIIGGHMGILFGVVNQLMLAGLAIGLLAVVILGYRMWWLRRPMREGKTSFAPALAPRSLWRLPKAQLAAVVTVAAVVGYLVPLLGLSLLAFVLIDAVVSRVGTNHA